MTNITNSSQSGAMTKKVQPEETKVVVAVDSEGKASPIGNAKLPITGEIVGTTTFNKAYSQLENKRKTFDGLYRKEWRVLKDFHGVSLTHYKVETHGHTINLYMDDYSKIDYGPVTNHCINYEIDDFESSPYVSEPVVNSKESTVILIDSYVSVGSLSMGNLVCIKSQITAKCLRNVIALKVESLESPNVTITDSQLMDSYLRFKGERNSISKCSIIDTRLYGEMHIGDCVVQGSTLSSEEGSRVNKAYLTNFNLYAKAFHFNPINTQHLSNIHLNLREECVVIKHPFDIGVFSDGKDPVPYARTRQQYSKECISLSIKYGKTLSIPLDSNEMKLKQLLGERLEIPADELEPNPFISHDSSTGMINRLLAQALYAQVRSRLKILNLISDMERNFII